MSFSLLAPLAMALGVLALGPLIAHLTQQKPSQRQAYGAMMLLRRLVKRLERRRRLQDLLLLLLRTLVVVAVALAAARPELTVPGDAPEFGGQGVVIFVLDDSMSMAQSSGGRTLMSRARTDALELLSELPPGTQVAGVRIGGRAQKLTDLSLDHELLARRIESLDAGYGGTDLVGGLHQARGLLAGAPGEVLVFTDQAGPGVVQAAEEEIQALVDRGSAVIPRLVLAKPPKNVVVLSAAYGDGLEGGSVRVELANYGPEEIEVPVTLTLPDDSTITAFATISGQGRQSKAFTVPLSVPGGVATVRVDDPDLALDDAYSLQLPRVGASRVLVVDGDPGRTPFESEVYFLERALAPWGAATGGLLPEVVSPSGLRRLESSEHRVVFLANVEDPGPYAATLTEFVRGGGGLVISAGKNVTAQRYNEALHELLPAPLRSATSVANADGVRLQSPDLTAAAGSGLFEPFKRGGYTGFSELNAFRLFTLEPFNEDQDVRVLLRWSDGNPALIERRVGLGRVLLWTTTFDYDDNWSHAAVQAVFMPLIQRLVRTLGGASAGDQLRAEGLVGEPVVLELPGKSLEPQVTGPDGEPVALQVERGQALKLRFVPNSPGAYAIGLPQEPPSALVAVNVPPRESDVRVSGSIAELERSIAPELLSRQIQLGPIALWVALAALVLQALLAAKITAIAGAQDEAA